MSNGRLDAGDLPAVVERRSVPTRRSARLTLLHAAFTNWRLPGYLGSVAYRVRRFSHPAFDALMDLRLDLKTRQGPRIFARLRDVNAPGEVFGLGEYEYPWLDWSRFDYVLDIGAHVGAFTAWVTARSKCRILALEPNPATRALLEANVKRLHLGDRVAVRGWALAGGPGVRRLRPDADSAASGLVLDVAIGDVQVEAVDLAGAIAAAGFPHVDVVKMDIEGAEYEVFESGAAGMIQTPDYWVVECHPVDGIPIDSVERALESAGYEVAIVVKPYGQQLVIGRRPRGMERQNPTSHQT
jgi:FkbM family methyltransferase